MQYAWKEARTAGLFQGIEQIRLVLRWIGRSEKEIHALETQVELRVADDDATKRLGWIRLIVLSSYEINQW